MSLTAPNPRLQRKKPSKHTKSPFPPGFKGGSMKHFWVYERIITAFYQLPGAK